MFKQKYLEIVELVRLHDVLPGRLPALDAVEEDVDGAGHDATVGGGALWKVKVKEIHRN